MAGAVITFMYMITKVKNAYEKENQEQKKQQIQVKPKNKKIK